MTGVSEKRNVLLALTGSIAAYKGAELARLFVQRGYNVRTVMTKSAQEFISPLTLSSITGHAVTKDFWEDALVEGIEHIELADWAEIVVVAPATADTLAKMALGTADNPLLAIVLATRAPVLVAPAMNVNMYEHPATQRNLQILRERGVAVVNPEEGALACGWNGSGRLADPWQIFHFARRMLSTGDYKGKRILISTGPTREDIDPVRFVSNRSSGKMGVALATEAFCRGAEVTLVHGPISVKVPAAVDCVPVISAIEMHDAIMERAFNLKQPYDALIMAAAVSDYRPEKSADTKIKRGAKKVSLSLVENPDILTELGEQRGDLKRPVLAGFAVETGEIEELIEEAREKMKRKGADLIVGNFAQEAFDLDTNRVWIVDRAGRQEEVATTFKSRVANRVLDSILRL